MTPDCDTKNCLELVKQRFLECGWVSIILSMKDETSRKKALTRQIDLRRDGTQDDDYWKKADGKM
jgi:hypothetical protein